MKPNTMWQNLPQNSNLLEDTWPSCYGWEIKSGGAQWEKINPVGSVVRVLLCMHQWHQLVA